MKVREAQVSIVLIRGSVVALLVTEAILTLLCYWGGAALTYTGDLDLYLWYENGAVAMGLVTGSVLLGIYFNDLYDQIRVQSRILLLQQFCLVIGLAFLAQALLSYANRELMLPRWTMIAGSSGALVVLPLWRVFYSGLVVRALGSRKVLFVGQNQLVRQISEYVTSRPDFAIQPVGYLAESESEEQCEYTGPYHGTLADLKAVAAKLKPDLIAVGLEERRGKLPIYDLLDLRLRGVRIEDVASLYESIYGRVSVRTIRPSQLVFTSELGPNPRHVSLQNFYSFAIALVGAIITAPIMLIVAVLVKLTSKGPALYRQTRVGLNGQEFQVFKFRSMYVDAEARTGAVWASKNDPRITPLGRYLRKLRLDELPQFFNVLRGEMSIVGPRPERPEFVKTLAEQIPFYGQRHSVKPGVTGWAQINHKYGDTIEDTISKLEYDLYYLKHLGPGLDFYIIFQTAKVMLLSRGAQ